MKQHQHRANDTGKPAEAAKGACLYKIGENATVVAPNALSAGNWELVLKRATGGKQVYCTVTDDGTIKDWSEMSQLQ
jgi:hypothetical protein